jgi:hypothetical protein
MYSKGIRLSQSWKKITHCKFCASGRHVRCVVPLGCHQSFARAHGLPLVLPHKITCLWNVSLFTLQTNWFSHATWTDCSTFSIFFLRCDKYIRVIFKENKHHYFDESDIQVFKNLNLRVVELHSWMTVHMPVTMWGRTKRPKVRPSPLCREKRAHFFLETNSKIRSTGTKHLWQTQEVQ